MMVDSDGPKLHSPAAATKPVQVPDRQKIATTPAIVAAMAASKQMKRRFPCLITISPQKRAATLTLLSAHYVVLTAEKTSALIRLHASDLTSSAITRNYSFLDFS